MSIRTEGAISDRYYWAFRRGIGAEADWLEGIARLGRSRAGAIRGVGAKALAEVDAALAEHGLDWAEPTDPYEPLGVPETEAGHLKPHRRSGSRRVSRQDVAVVRRLVSAAFEGADDEVAELVARFAADIREACGVDSVLAEIWIARVVGGMTLKQIAVRNSITRERVRQRTVSLNNRGFAAIQESRARHFLRTRADELRALFRSGLLPDEVSCQLTSERDSAFTRALTSGMLKNSPFTARDRSIHWLMRRPYQRRSAEHWSNSQILAAIRHVATEYCSGRAPTVTEYEEARVREQRVDGSYTIPSVPLVGNRFRSWNRARMLAGFTVNLRGPRSDKEWTADEILPRVFDLVRELDELPSVARFDQIARARPALPHPRALPGAGTIRVELGHIKLGKWVDLRAMIYQSLIDLGEWEV